MLKWGIDDAKLEAARKGKDANAVADKIVQVTHTFTGIYHYGLFSIGSGVGNGLGNLMIGNDLGNTFDGLGGNDTMIGGAGDDGYWVQDAGDTVVWAAAGIRLNSRQAL